MEDELRRQVRTMLMFSGRKQKWCAQQLGISEKHLSQMLTGRAHLTLDWAQRIAVLNGHTVTISITQNRSSLHERG